MGEIRAGQKLKLSFITVENSKVEFICHIKRINKDRLSLKFPEELLEYSDDLEEGTEVIASVFTPAGVKIFDSIVLDSPLEQDFVIEYAEIAEEIQRREYIRVKLETKIVLKIGAWNLVTHSLDMSGGGIRFYYEGSFYPNEEAEVTVYLPDTRLVQAKGIIIKNKHLTPGTHVLIFTEIAERDRDRIVKQCFDIQTAKQDEEEV